MPWVVHDVNGYYRALGFSFPFKPTRKELREAYLEHGGVDDPRLTSIMVLLLDPVTRRAYDSQPPGQPYVDSMLLESFLPGIAAAAARLDVSPHELVESIKLAKEFAEPPSAEPVSSASVPGTWSYYCHQSECQDLEKLVRWQALLVRRVPASRFAVGFTSGHRGEIHWRQEGPIVLIPDQEQPTERLAANTTRQLHADADYRLDADYTLTQHRRKTTMPTKYLSGQDAIDAAAKDADTFSSGGRKFSYMGADVKENGSEIFIRMLDDFEDTDGDGENFAITVVCHNWVPTKPAPEDMDEEKKKSWPELMRAVCRMQSALPGEHESCYICDNVTKPDKNKVERKWPKTSVTFARAIARTRTKVTQKMIDDGAAPEKALGQWAWSDVEIEVDVLDDDGKPTGEKRTQTKIYLIEQNYKGFFDRIRSVGGEFGTVLDRDFKVTREGTGLKTEWHVVAMKETPEFDLNDPETRAEYDEIVSFGDLTDHVDRLHSDEHYERFFDCRVSNASGGEATSNGERPEKAEDAPSPAAVQKMRERVAGNRKQPQVTT